MMLGGNRFMKYGRRGQPHIKFVILTTRGQLYWSWDDETYSDPKWYV
jgi:hypothetical protein